ncbi:MAG: GtrA family protein [Pseudomonadota bacterium]
MVELLARHRQFLMYLAGGVLSALVDVGLLQLLLWNGVNFVLATSAGFGVGLVFNFSFHARLTFRSAMTHHVFLRYMCVVGLNYLITLACVSLAVHLLVPPIAGKIVALFIVPVNGFLLGKFWVFKQ